MIAIGEHSAGSVGDMSDDERREIDAGGFGCTIDEISLRGGGADFEPTVPSSS